MSKKEQVEQLTNYMANFVDHIGKVLPDDIIEKLDELADKGGAKRVELNSALSVGGLTPTLATLKRVKRDTDLKVICMDRPRAAGFAYSFSEFETMKRRMQKVKKRFV